MQKKLYASSIWGGMRKVKQCGTCHDCGTFVASHELGDRYYFMLGPISEKRSMVKVGSYHEMKSDFASAHKNLFQVHPLDIYNGRDEDGQSHIYCKSCSEKVIEATCSRCGDKFNRTRGLIGGWSCDKCFSIHCTAMCNITPGERVAGLVWGDDAANAHYEREFEIAKHKWTIVEIGDEDGA